MAEPPPPPPPPTGWASPPPPPAAYVAPKKRSGCAKTLAIGAAAFLGLVVLIAVASGTDEEPVAQGPEGQEPEEGATCDETPSDQALDTQRVGLHENRPDTQPDNDHEAAIGDCVRVQGRTAWVFAVGQSDGLVLVRVRIENRDDKAQPYNAFNWRLQTPSGQVLDPTFLYTGDEYLGSGDLVPGGQVTGTVGFEAPLEGDSYVIWKPDGLSAARGVWEVN